MVASTPSVISVSQMNNNTIHIAVGLRLGTPLCRPHTCHHCGSDVDCLATHDLSCRWSEDLHFQHALLNDIVHRALSSAKVPYQLKPAGTYHSNGKRLDGIIVVPWERGKLLVWDATCLDTFAPSYILRAAGKEGAVAAPAETKRWKNISTLMHTTGLLPYLWKQLESLVF